MRLMFSRQSASQDNSLLTQFFHLIDWRQKRPSEKAVARLLSLTLDVTLGKTRQSVECRTHSSLLVCPVVMQRP